MDRPSSVQKKKKSTTLLCFVKILKMQIMASCNYLQKTHLQKNI